MRSHNAGRCETDGVSMLASPPKAPLHSIVMAS
jgi:hypothetical protein